MRLNVPIDDFGHDSVDRTARGRDYPHHVAATLIRDEGPFNRIDLTSKASDPIQQLLLLSHRMRHRVPPLYPGIVVIYPPEYI